MTGERILLCLLIQGFEICEHWTCNDRGEISVLGSYDKTSFKTCDHSSALPTRSYALSDGRTRTAGSLDPLRHDRTAVCALHVHLIPRVVGASFLAVFRITFETMASKFTPQI